MKFETYNRHMKSYPAWKSGEHGKFLGLKILFLLHWYVNLKLQNLTAVLECGQLYWSILI